MNVIAYSEPEVCDAQERETARRKTDIGRGCLPVRMEKPIVYAAGRMEGHQCGEDWRTAITELQDKGGNDGPDPVYDAILDCGAFWYGGPFVVGSTGGHTNGHTGWPEHRRDIWDIDRLQIDRAHLVVAYLADAEAFGTLVEIGYAAGRGKPIALGFSNRMKRDDYDELWLARMPAAKIYWGTPADVWHEVKVDWIKRPGPKPEARAGAQHG